MASMAREPITHDGMIVVGIDVRTSNAAESDPSKARLPVLWGRFYKEGLLDRVPRKKAPVLPVGVYNDYESDDTGEYRVVAGAAVEEATAVPDGLASVRLPAGRYLVFRGEGQMPHVVVQTWRSVWDYFSKSGVIARAFTADFERYSGPNAVDIYIAVK